MLNAILNRYRQIPFHFMDVVVLGYILLLGILVIPFHHDVINWWKVPIVHFILILIILEYLLQVTKRKSRLFQFLRIFYPALLLSSAWKELDNLFTMIFPYYGNELVKALDKMLFGVHPTVWVEQLFTPWLTELMFFLYFSHYLLLPVLALGLFFKKGHGATLNLLALVCFNYALSYLCFILIPAEGAWVILKNMHTVEPEGGFFMHLVQFIQSQGTVRGGAIPSSHVTATFVLILAMFEHSRKLTYWLLPLGLGIAVSTVYCRYHHAVDAITGILMGIGFFMLGKKLLTKWQIRHTPSDE